VYRAIDVSHEIRRSVFSSLVKIAERYVVRNVNMTLANNEAMSRHVIDLGASPKRVQVLFPGVAGIDLGSRVDTSSKRSDVLLFMGTLFDFCGVADLITWISTWGKAAKDCELWILGGGGALSQIVLRADQNNFEIKLLGIVPFGELYEVMSQATIAVLPFEEIPVAHKALPGKVPQYIVAGLPVVSTRLEGLRSLLPNEVGVLYVEPGEEFVKRIDELLGDQNMRNKVVSAGQEYLRLHCSWPSVISEIEYLLSELVDQEGAGK
jgi:glycosyltransferase involved in cell wall biosynthesis